MTSGCAAQETCDTFLHTVNPREDMFSHNALPKGFVPHWDALATQSNKTPHLRRCVCVHVCVFGVRAGGGG